MTKKNQPAFPTVDRDGNWQPHNDGLTLRQYYAARAMQALLNDAWYKSRMLNEGHTAKEIGPDLAQDAFILADAMIEAENEPKNP